LSDLLWILECEGTPKPVSQIRSRIAFRPVCGRDGLQLLCVTVNVFNTQ